MRALDLAGAGVHAGGDDLVRCQLLDEHADADDVRDGIHVAHFVEVDLSDGGAVDVALRLREDVIDVLCVLLDLVRHLEAPDDGFYIAERMVCVMVLVFVMMVMLVTVVMGMIVVVAVMADFEVFLRSQFDNRVFRQHVGSLFDVVVCHPEMGPKNALLLGGQGINFDTWDSDGVDFLKDVLLVLCEFPERSGHHISGRSVPTVKVQCFH